MTTTVLLVDDCKDVIAGMRAVFNRTDEFRIIGEANDGLQAIYLARNLKPDVVVMDI